MEEETPKIEHYGEGIIIRGKGGKFQPGSRSPAPITAENAHALARRGVEKYRRAAARAITEEVKSINPSVAHSADAWGFVIAEQLTKLLDQRKPNAQVLEVLGRSIGAFVPAAELGAPAQSTADSTRELIADLALIASRLPPSAG